ncbi:28948_t:CDS:2 [Gigaspora margarita]|uniref:28948_t:CDS:1 n=1 Tax=Gigaspora margarita TaxID=4874 RepID=A0ABN7V163_GIGMA|nr:28948_t:CDS:2 [Gigaspora margarita]
MSLKLYLILFIILVTPTVIYTSPIHDSPSLESFEAGFMAVAKFDASIVPRGAFCAFIINAFIASVGIALIAALGAAATPLTIGTFTITGAAMVFIVELCKQSAFALADLIIRETCGE